jgi:WD40 repeat protein
MRAVEAASRGDVDPAGERSGRGRSEATRSGRWKARRIGWLLAGAILLPWLPVEGWEPPSHPSRRAAGRSRRSILDLAYGPGGRVLATADERGIVTLWDADGGGCPGPEIEVHGHARSIAFLPDGRHLAIGGDEPGVILWDLTRGRPGRFLDLPFRWTYELAPSPDGRLLAVSGEGASS